MTGCAIEPERADDAAAISRVVGIAFSDGGRRSGEGEVSLIGLLRASDAWIPELALVARLNDEVNGHLLFSRAVVESPRGNVPVLALAPLAVLPGFESTFAGTRLMRHGLAEGRRLGHGAVVVLGHPKYYRRFGFRLALPMGIRYPGPVPEEAWMVLELIPGALTGVTGDVRYPPAFDAVAPRARRAAANESEIANREP